MKSLNLPKNGIGKKEKLSSIISSFFYQNWDGEERETELC